MARGILCVFEEFQSLLKIKKLAGGKEKPYYRITTHMRI